MNLSGNYSFDADQQTVWGLLTDPNAIAKALPGVDALVPIEGESMAWRADAKIGISIISGVFSGVVRMTDVQPPQGYRLNVTGEGQQSVVSGYATIVLTPAAGGAKTTLDWTGEANISGKLAGIGQRLIGSAASMMAKQFFQGLAKQLPST